MTYDQLTAQIADAIRPNGTQAITGQVLQDVLLSIAAYVKDGNDDIVSVIETSIQPTLNAKVSQPTFDAFKEESVARVNTLEGVFEATDERIDTLQEEVDIKENQTNVSYYNPSNDLADEYIVHLRPHEFTVIEEPLYTIHVEDDLAEGAGELSEMMSGFQFVTSTSSSSSLTINWPDSIKLQEEPVFETNHTYQVTVLNGLALITGWPNE